MNERWRVALAGLVAALAVPFLIIDSPAPAGGVETSDQKTPQQLAAPADEPVPTVDLATRTNAVEIVVTTKEVSPDISRLADQAGTWGRARSQAVTDGLVAASFTPPPSETNYALLPVVKAKPTSAVKSEPPVAVDPPAAEEPVTEAPAVESEQPVSEEPSVDEPKPAPAPTPSDEVDPTPDAEVESATAPTTDPATDPAPETTTDPAPEPAPDATPEPDAEPAPVADKPGVPAQVNGRVPPPAGGPTAAQWNALRKCESTHNYGAVSPSGLYRGAYQFSQQTWDWVAAIHWPHLVGVDPVAAQPAWQDVMAYTLYAMRGWDQWPICGKNLL